VISPEPLQPSLARLIAHITAEPETLAAEVAGGVVQQHFRTVAHQVLPALLQGEFDVVAAAGVFAGPAGCRHRLAAAGVHQQPAPALALIQQILDAPILQLAQLGRAGALLQVPEQGGVAAAEGLELQFARQRPRRRRSAQGVVRRCWSCQQLPLRLSRRLTISPSAS